MLKTTTNPKTGKTYKEVGKVALWAEAPGSGKPYSHTGTVSIPLEAFDSIIEDLNNNAPITAIRNNEEFVNIRVFIYPNSNKQSDRSPDASGPMTVEVAETVKSDVPF